MFDRVFIDSQMNASVSRAGGIFGFFGMGPIVLTIGLPLMQAQTPRQLAGAIGHEYGHVAAKDNALGQWIYRIRNSWLALDDKLRFEHLWYVLKLNRFYEWFMSVFSAHSFVLSRQCEYEADAFSARVTGKEAMAEALSSLVIYGETYDAAFWKKIWEKSDSGADIREMTPYAEVPAFFRDIGDMSETVNRALKTKTDYASTHPSVSDRLAALGQPFALPEAPGNQSAAWLLGATEQKLIAHFNAEWQAAAGEHWQRCQEERAHWQAQYAELKEKPFSDLDDDALSALISAANYMEDHPLFYRANQEMLRRHPEEAGAEMNCLWYRLIIEKDPTQLEVAEEFLRRHPAFLPNVCRHAIAYLQQAGREDEAAAYRARLEDWQHLDDAATEERSTITTKDNFLPHGLPEAFVQELVAYIKTHPMIARVYLARKEVKYIPERPSYILAFRVKSGMFDSQKKVNNSIGDFIYRSGLPEDFIFIQADSVQGIEAKLKKTEGALIYTK